MFVFPRLFRFRAPAGARSGSALLLSLWALLVLSLAVFAWVKFIQMQMDASYQTDIGLEARAYAHSGVQVALHPLVTTLTPQLTQEFGAERGYTTQIVGEGGKLNINWLLQGENPTRVAILKHYLGLRGLDLHQTDVLVDSLLDWIDRDNVKHTNGAEDGPDYHPPNRALQSVDEIAQVNGAAPLIKQKGWQDDFTIYSTGRVDVLAAPAMVLNSLPGVNEGSVDRFLQLRRGPDKKDGTEDDYVFPKDINQILNYLGVSGTQPLATIRPVVTFNDATVFITSTGHVGNLTRQTKVVARKGNNAPNILLWKDL